MIIAWLLTFPINALLYSMTDLKNVAHLNPVHAITLIIVSTVLTIIGGHMPARMAAKKTRRLRYDQNNKLKKSSTRNCKV